MMRLWKLIAIIIHALALLASADDQRIEGVYRRAELKLDPPLDLRPEPRLELIAERVDAPRPSVYASQKRTVELWMAPFFCPPCNRLARELGNGDEFIQVQRVKSSTAVPQGTTYPFVMFEDSNGTRHALSGVQSLAQLQRNIDRIEKQESRGPANSGVSIAGKAVIEKMLADLLAFAGDGATAEFAWHREGGLDSFPIDKPASRTDITGTAGRVSLSIKTANQLPVTSISFKYRFDLDGKFFVDPDEFQVLIPESGATGEARAAMGDPIIVAYTVIEIIIAIWDLFHPSIQIGLGNDIAGNATLSNGHLDCQFTQGMPQLRIMWAFFLNLLKTELDRPLTGALIGVDAVIAQFHTCRVYRDVSMEVR